MPACYNTPNLLQRWWWDREETHQELALNVARPATGWKKRPLLQPLPGSCSNCGQAGYWGVYRFTLHRQGRTVTQVPTLQEKSGPGSCRLILPWELCLQGPWRTQCGCPGSQWASASFSRFRSCLVCTFHLLRWNLSFLDLFTCKLWAFGPIT